MRKQARRTIREPRLVYGEGGDDATWLKYVKSLLYSRSYNFVISINNGNGGSPVEVVRSMMKLTGFDQYVDRHVLFDSDREEVEEAVELARKNSITPIISRGCLEAELLAIAGKGVVIPKCGNSMNTRRIKQKFIEECGGHGERNYERYFPKQLLDRARTDNEWLDKIMCLFEQK